MEAQKLLEVGLLCRPHDACCGLLLANRSTCVRIVAPTLASKAEMSRCEGWESKQPCCLQLQALTCLPVCVRMRQGFACSLVIA